MGEKVRIGHSAPRRGSVTAEVTWDPAPEEAEDRVGSGTDTDDTPPFEGGDGQAETVKGPDGQEYYWNPVSGQYEYQDGPNDPHRTITIEGTEVGAQTYVWDHQGQCGEPGPTVNGSVRVGGILP